MQIPAVIADTAIAWRILDHLNLDSTGPPVTRAQGPPGLCEPAPDYDGADPVYPD
jgi:hypothetical protein